MFSKLYHFFKKLLLSPVPIRLNLIISLLKIWKIGSFRSRVRYDAVDYPHYAYCMMNAADQAKAQGLKKISAIEFGVASGNGLIAMERIAFEIEKELGIKFELYGFDTGKGLPDNNNNDYRDQIYFWKPGSFPMDEDALQAKLNRSKLILGNVKNTLKDFFSKIDPAPIAFISFDLDYYSSTRDALRVFNNNNQYYLPRVECYIDDIGSFETLSANPETGVLLAINEFNNKMKTKLYKKEQVDRLRLIPAPWNDCIYVHHNFYHENYNLFIPKTASNF